MSKFKPFHEFQKPLIGFIWNRLDEMFEKGFLETVRYKEQYGDPNAPDSCKLGKRQGKQRQSYKKESYLLKESKDLKK